MSSPTDEEAAMGQHEPAATAIVERVRAALESADPSVISDLLHPDVRWGAPGDPEPGCQSRAQVLDWYRRGRAAGVRARVAEATQHGDKLLIGLTVSGNPAADAHSGGVDRWQVLTVRDGLMVDIRTFDRRDDAAAMAATSA